MLHDTRAQVTQPPPEVLHKADAGCRACARPGAALGAKNPLVLYYHHDPKIQVDVTKNSDQSFDIKCKGAACASSTVGQCQKINNGPGPSLASMAYTGVCSSRNDEDSLK